jgi:broad-specificity NMP kinase
VRAVLITGPPGSGKTSVLAALSALVTEPHACVEMELEGLDGVRRADAELLLLVDTIESEDELARLIEAVDADEAFVVRLRAEPDTLAERIIAREPPDWEGTEALAEHARAMAPVGGADLELSTEGRTAEDVAAQIRKTARL